MIEWLKEPLLHFLLLGALLFGLYSLLNPEEASFTDNRIVVSAGDIERLSVNWEQRRNRPPTDSELQMLIDSYIREEVYYREALALGLDQNDAVLRRRMMQKMEFLTNDIADLSQPDETALNQYFLTNQDKYELPARISFTHIYFSSTKHGQQLHDNAAKALAEISVAAETVFRAQELGDSFMHQHDFTLETSFEISRLFGDGFAARVFQLQSDGWQGPIESGYGLHLVRVNQKVDASSPELGSVVDQVRNDWMFEQRQKINKEIYDQFRQRYEIVVEERTKSPETALAPAKDGKSS